MSALATVDPVTLLSGCMALSAGLALGWSAVISSPKHKAFQCLPRALRVSGGLGAGGMMFRGVVLVFSANGPDARHSHADLPVGWALVLQFCVVILCCLLATRMNPDIRDRMERRNAARLKTVKRLLHSGDIASAGQVAEGEGAVPTVVDLGLSTAAIAALKRM